MMSAEEEYHLRKISREWNWEMLRILGETPVETPGLSVVFDRQPDIFAIPRLFSERLECVGFFRGASLAGFAMLMFQRRLVNGKPRTVAYFGNVRVKKEARGRGFFYRAAGCLSKEMRGGPDRHVPAVCRPSHALTSRAAVRAPRIEFTKLQLWTRKPAHRR
ncbi:MAG: hypothetical protein IMZ57_00880 [Acidobacteria bacterium]|nr:hypothetical protein [Acidobacteriota bacterium]